MKKVMLKFYADCGNKMSSYALENLINLYFCIFKICFKFLSSFLYRLMDMHKELVSISA